MEVSKFAHLGKFKFGLTAVVAVAAVSGAGSTSVGQRFFAQIGISNSLAQTAEAAERIAVNGSNAVQAFLGRSPGERGATDILKGKAQRSLAENAKAPSERKPTQRALGKIFEEPLQSLAGPSAPAQNVEFLPLDAGSVPAAIPALAMLPVGSGIFSPVTGGIPSGGGVIGGGGGSGGTGDGSLPPAPPPIATAVPEPSTWMLLLIGFAAVGASIRRGKARKVWGSGQAGNCATV
ncbi:PEPxxWA-CTERM sorting domain-containing protein [Sphingorhabdus sp.]|uniref:PEPxxWA-CTERM sorting domain-containing protein n=1 Tax=Sphingorhabdus sp. TaxID=1902408 RepID=UPI003919F0EF